MTLHKSVLLYGILIERLIVGFTLLLFPEISQRAIGAPKPSLSGTSRLFTMMTGVRHLALGYFLWFTRANENELRRAALVNAGVEFADALSMARVRAGEVRAHRPSSWMSAGGLIGGLGCAVLAFSGRPRRGTS